MDYKKIVGGALSGLEHRCGIVGEYGMTVYFRAIDRAAILDRIDRHNIPIIGATETTVTIPTR
jgi:hypothetical protein